MTLSDRFVEFSVPALDSFGLFSAVDKIAAFLEPILVADLFERVSTDTVRGFGCGNGAISMVSVRLIRQEQFRVGEIVIGRVMVEVIIYEMVPRSNYQSTISLCDLKKLACTYI